nr:nitroreductase family protein [Bacteroides sp.]
MSVKKAFGIILKKIVPFRVYKLICNGAILVPSYYKTIINDAERNFDMALGDSDEKEILLMRKYGHILDKGLHRKDASPGHSGRYYHLLKQSVNHLIKTKYANDPTVLWAIKKLEAYEKLQSGNGFEPLCGQKPEHVISFNEFKDLVEARRSNRDFSDKPVLQEDMNKLIRLANWASSSCNKQPIFIHATNNPDLASKCLKCCKGGTGFSNHIPSFWAFSADVLGYVWPSEIYLPVVDTCLGVQNVMLGATTLGISGTLLSWAQKSSEEEAELRKLLNIPTHHQIVLCAVMGYANSEFEVPARKEI